MAYIKTRDEVELFVKSWGEGRPVSATASDPLKRDLLTFVGA